MAQLSTQTQRQSRRLSQWSSKRVSRRQSSGGRAPKSLTCGNGRLRGLQMLWGTLLPLKEPGLSDGESSEDDDGPDEEEEEPQFLDSEEMDGGGVVLQSAFCRRRTVTIDDHICQKKFEVTGRFPLLGPWWEVRVYVYMKPIRSMYYMKGFPSYFLRTHFRTKKEGVLPLFLKECNVPEEFKEKFLKWLPQKLLLTFHNLEDILQEFSTAMDPEKGGYNILKYVRSSCTGVNVKNALRFPLIMEYVPTLLPRLFKNLLKWKPKRRNGEGEETEEAEGLFTKVETLTKIEEMLNKYPWKLGFGRITASYYNWHQLDSQNEWKFSKVEVLVVDEGSLVSVQILSSVLVLLCKYANLAKLIILGDVRQLPSIDPGNMLADLFQSAKYIHWAIELRTNHRAESQLIVDNATRISEQRFVQFDAVVEIGKQSDVTMPSSESKFILISLPEDGNDDDLQTAVKLLLEKGPGLQDDKTSQFIAFRRVDCDLINELCCQHYSGHSTINSKNKPVFQCHDKVCCTKNAYITDLVPSAKSDTVIKDRTLIHNEGEAPLVIGERNPVNNETTEEKTNLQSMYSKDDRLCNGEIFFITDDVEKDKIRCLTISDMDEREYTLDYLKLYRICNIKHAWARTIHTFQGSEEGTVVYVVGAAGRQNWQHVYTAVTRGRQRVYIVAKKDQLVKAVFNKCCPRKTRLRQRVQETLSQRKDCAAPTSSPLQLIQESIEPYSCMISSQEEDMTLLNSQEINGEKDTGAIGSKALCDHNNTSSNVIVYDELTDSDLEAAIQLLEQKQVSNANKFPQSPMTNLQLESHDISSPKFPLQQQDHGLCGVSDVSAVGGFVAVHGSGDWDKSPTGEGSTADSFGELNDSELDMLFHSPLYEASNNGDSLFATSGIKRLSTEEEVPESPLKISRVTLDESPLGCTRFRDLSLTTACQKQLF
ncbi:DNA helicase B isoform X2 [Pleurodeles waltl]|uniref:DNA helicase B isoform X2 n=1 Tax=Pleurodeles waltl TaxID=8319 RepID=UPI00370956AF